MWKNAAVRPLRLSEECQIDNGDSIDLGEKVTPKPWTTIQVPGPQGESVRYAHSDACQIDTGDSIDLGEKLTPNPWTAIQIVGGPLVTPTPALLCGDTRLRLAV